MKDSLGLRVPRLCYIPCSCALVYIGQTGHTILEGGKEQPWYLCLGQPDKAALMEHACKLNSEVLFSATKALYHSESYWEHVILESLEIRLHGGTVDRDAGLRLSSTWKGAIHLLESSSDTDWSHVTN